MATKKKTTIEQELLDKIIALSAEVQQLKQQRQQPVVVAKRRERGEARPEVYYVLHGVPAKGLPPQAIACARILATAANTNHIPESEAMALLEAGKQTGRLKTNQDSWHIFQYYRAKLIEGDYLRMLTVASA